MYPAIIVFGLIGLSLLFVGMVDSAVEDRDIKDYYAQEVTLYGKDCIVLNQFSQVALTCDWSK